jgi:hypothetical protein
MKVKYIIIGLFVACIATMSAYNVKLSIGKTNHAMQLVSFQTISALTQESNNWEGKKLKLVECTCKINNKDRIGDTFRCRINGNLEQCTITQQGSNACYNVGMFGISIMCENPISFAGEL